jgi:hypothetical protein
MGFTRSVGAGERVRTVDLNLGKVALYQLSYTRFGAPILRPHGAKSSNLFGV